MQVIPAHPLALTAQRKLDERRQRALTRYYVASGVTGLAVGVHTTQFAIREAGLLRPVLELAADEMRGKQLTKIAGAVGPTSQAVSEAELARSLGYDAVLLSVAALKTATDDELIEHTRQVASVIPVAGFYLQNSVGGRPLSLAYWRRFCELPGIFGVKIAPFNRYQTVDVVRAVAESGRDIPLFTGNDDSILTDLATEWEISGKSLRFAGGLLGHWSVWTSLAPRHAALAQKGGSPELLTLAAQVTDSNAALFDPSHNFAGCIAGLHEVLRRQGLLEGTWCLDPHEDLSPGQAEEIDRIYGVYPHLTDDDFVRENLANWLR